MKRELLKSLDISDSDIDKIMAEYGKSVTEYKAKILDLEGQVNAHKKQLSDRESEIDMLKKSVGDSDALREQISKLQDEAKSSKDSYESKIREISIDKAVTVDLMKAGAKNIKAVRALLTLDKAELDETGNIKGLDKQIESLKQSDAYMFNGDTKLTIEGTKPGEGSGKAATKPYNQMTYTERVAFLNAGGQPTN